MLAFLYFTDDGGEPVMAMNKKEKEAFEEARSYRALRFTDHPTSKDLAPGSELITGYDYRKPSFTESMISIKTAWSTRSKHGEGKAPPPANTFGGVSRDGISLYSSRKRALGALRRELEREFARILMKIDDEIAAEEAKEG
nr:hypothetical protein [Proteus vulgaris]